MCELMGLCFKKPVSADFSIQEFALRSEENADGWGLAWYPDHSLAVLKEPIKWQASQFTKFLETYSGLIARIYIAHVRHKTTGGVATHADTHPFNRELRGKDYCLAHNGTLEGAFWQKSLGRFHPVGQTDSEYLLCNLLHQLVEREERLVDESGWRWLAGELKDLNGFGKLNAILSDGQRLFCYHDKAGFKGLHFRRILMSDNEIRRFEDASMRLDLAGDDVNQGFVIATRPLSQSSWHPFQAGELIVFGNGLVQFSSQRESVG